MHCANMVVFFFLPAFSLAASIHLGLKAAVDEGDIKKAEALVKKLNVQDIYCPASLSWADAKKIYGDFFIENPNEMFSTCEPEFVENYNRISCTKKEEASLCLEMMKRVPLTEWQPYLDNIQKNKLQKGTEIYETTEMVKEKMNPGEQSTCQNNVDLSKTLLAEYEKDLVRRLKSGQGSASGAGAQDLFVLDLQYTIDSLKQDIKKSESLCKAGLKEVSQPVKKTRTKNFFLPSLHKLYIYLNSKMSQPFGFDEKTKNLYDLYEKIAEKGSEFPKEQALIDELTDLYSRDGDIDDYKVLYACRLYPKIDKDYAKKMEIELFSCQKMMRKYGEVCEALNEDEELSVMTTLNGQKPVSYRCNGKEWYAKSVAESVLGDCDESKNNEKYFFEGKLYACLNSTWSELGLVDFATLGMDCDKSMEGKFVKHKASNTIFECKDGMWRYGMLDRDGSVVKSSLVGNYVWNLEDVNARVQNAVCPANDESLCNRYSRLYSYDVAKEACPNGWKLPDTNQVKNLLYSMDSWKETAEGNFGKYPGAMRDEFGFDKESKSASYFWVRQENDVFKAAQVELKGGREVVSMESLDNGRRSLPLRCVLDFSDMNVFAGGYEFDGTVAAPARAVAPKPSKEKSAPAKGKSAKGVVKIASVKGIKIELEGISKFINANDFSAFLKDEKDALQKIYQKVLASNQDAETAIRFYLVINAKTGEIEEVQDLSSKEELAQPAHKQLFIKLAKYMQSRWNFGKGKKRGKAFVEFPLKLVKE